MRFDAVLLIAFGGPQGQADIRPFLANVLKGRPVAPGRVEEAAHHYELFGGVSPITEATRRQASGLQQRLAAAGVSLPVFVGMRNWHPLLADTLAEMSRAGLRHAIGFIMAAHSGYSSCEQYRENVRDARRSIRRDGLADVLVDVVGRLDRLFDGPMPYMLWFHQRPTDGRHWPGAHLHVHLAPLLRAPGTPRFVASGELGSGVFFNPVRPEDAAARLRDA